MERPIRGLWRHVGEHLPPDEHGRLHVHGVRNLSAHFPDAGAGGGRHGRRRAAVFVSAGGSEVVSVLLNKASGFSALAAGGAPDTVTAFAVGDADGDHKPTWSSAWPAARSRSCSTRPAARSAPRTRSGPSRRLRTIRDPRCRPRRRHRGRPPRHLRRRTGSLGPVCVDGRRRVEWPVVLPAEHERGVELGARRRRPQRRRGRGRRVRRGPVQRRDHPARRASHAPRRAHD